MVVKTIPAFVPFFFFFYWYDIFQFRSDLVFRFGVQYIYNIKNNNSEKYFKSYKIPTQNSKISNNK
jgi:hypothetical protein